MAANYLAQWIGGLKPATAIAVHVQHLGAPRDVQFIDPLHGWSRDGDRRTTDGGQTWSVAHSAGASAATFVSLTEGWVGGTRSEQYPWEREYCGWFIDHTTDGGDTWLRLSELGRRSPCDLSGGLEALYFVDSLYGWACVDHTTFKTTDGGHTWERAGYDGYLGEGWWWRKILDRTNGFRLVGADDAFCYWPETWLQVTLSKTTDAGTTWMEVGDLPRWAHGPLGPPWRSGYVGGGPYVSPDGNTLVVVGEAGHIARSTDGGATWTDVATPLADDLSWVAFADSATGWAAGPGGVVLRTSDGGLTWARQPLSTTPAITYLAAFSPDEALLSADRLYRTSNGGATWIALPNPTRATVEDFAPGSADVVWASAGNVLVTTDGGAQWRELDIAAVAVDAVDERHAWALGSQVWRTTDGGSQWQGLGGPTGGLDLDFVSPTRGWLLAPQGASSANAAQPPARGGE